MQNARFPFRRQFKNRICSHWFSAECLAFSLSLLPSSIEPATPPKTVSNVLPDGLLIVDSRCRVMARESRGSAASKLRGQPLFYYFKNPLADVISLLAAKRPVCLAMVLLPGISYPSLFRSAIARAFHWRQSAITVELIS